MNIIDFLTHTQTYLTEFIQNYGMWIYAFMFFIIFAETGLVITAFLPGDSLLFILGALASKGQLNIYILWIGLIVAAILGNLCNYAIGRYFGHYLQKKGWVNSAYLHKAESFFLKHGGKTVIFARFLPILRTFVPFASGLSHMPLWSYKMYTVIGALLWVSTFLILGYSLGHIPFIQNHLEEIVIVGFAAAALPLILAFCMKLFKKKSLQP